MEGAEENHVVMKPPGCCERKFVLELEGLAIDFTHALSSVSFITTLTQTKGNCFLFFFPPPFFSSFRRQDVLTLTPWLAPIVWDGTFNSEILDSAYKPLNLTIGVTAFAIGK